AQPAEQLRLVRSLELREVTVSLQEGFLHEVRGIDLALQALADLDAREQGQGAPVQLQELPQRPGIARAGLRPQVGQLGRHDGVARFVLIGYQLRPHANIGARKRGPPSLGSCWATTGRFPASLPRTVIRWVGTGGTVPYASRNSCSKRSARCCDSGGT